MTVKITYFVHGTTTDNEANIASGMKDVELSDLGVQQSIELKNKINIRNIDVVFCSDLQRAVYSANLTFENIVPIIIDSRLREIDCGDYNGDPVEIVEPIRLRSVSAQISNGESYEDVKKRIASFVEDLKKNYNGKHIAIVAHQAPQLAFDVILKGKSWQQAFAEDWRNTKSWQPGWEYEIKD